LSSFSLKVVEDYVGFARKAAECGGAWAMATFIEATETGDEKTQTDIDGQNRRLQQRRPGRTLGCLSVAEVQENLIAQRP
jgi:hypothetical protein